MAEHEHSVSYSFVYPIVSVQWEYDRVHVQYVRYSGDAEHGASELVIG